MSNEQTATTAVIAGTVEPIKPSLCMCLRPLANCCGPKSCALGKALETYLSSLVQFAETLASQRPAHAPAIERWKQEHAAALVRFVQSAP